MDNYEYIELAFDELKASEKPYKMYSEFSFMKGLQTNSPEFIKIRYLLRHNDLFQEHTDHAIKLSSKGLQVSYDYRNLKEYKKSQKKKRDYVKIITLAVAIISLIWNIYQNTTNNNLRDENNLLNEKIDSLKMNK
jgi:hypothetical protein